MRKTKKSRRSPKTKPRRATEVDQPGAWRTNLDSPIQRANPLQMYFSRKTLIGAVKANLNAVVRNTSTAELSEEDRELATEVISRNEAFLTWLMTTDQESIFCTIYPTSEFQEDSMTYWRAPIRGLA